VCLGAARRRLTGTES